MTDEANTKQQIVEKIKSCSNILVTVSTDPSVDELSAALGLTILLNKIGKHATSVVSGQLPRAIDFLEPDKTFENTADSLRDFIIALDKEKADHLRYKVEGDVVKIFITPYRTTITSDDLDFSQGDYNVELVLALGVKDRDHLDKALVAHGRILHDATVATISLGESSKLGSIDWQDSEASSYSEMLVALSESLKGDKPVLDEQIANAFLTGIVASTDRFSNNLTSSRVMTMAAQLMAAGANQQLIAAKLEDAAEIGQNKNETDDSQTNGVTGDAPNPDGTTDLAEGESTKLEKESRPDDASVVVESPKANDGSLTVEHQEAPVQSQPTSQPPFESLRDTEERLSRELSGVVQGEPRNVDTLSVADLQADLASASQEFDTAAEQSVSNVRSDDQPGSIDERGLVPPPTPQQKTEWQPPTYEEAAIPSFGGTLNATTEAAAQDKRTEEASNRNKGILHHGSGQYMGNNQPPAMQAPLNSTGALPDEPNINPFAESTEDSILSGDTQKTAYAADVSPLAGTQTVGPAGINNQSPTPTLADLDSRNRAPSQGFEDARAAVDNAINSAPFDSAYNPQIGVGAQQLGEINHNPSSDFAPELPLPPPIPPDFSSLPPLPPTNFNPPMQTQLEPDLPSDNLGDIFGTASQDYPQAPAPTSNDPGQFRIPGQQ